MKARLEPGSPLLALPFITPRERLKRDDTMAQQSTTDLAAIRAIVKKHLQRRLELTDETALVSGGLIDSMSLVDVILDL